MHVHFVDARFSYRSTTPHVLTLGMFDGVHVGHAALLRRAVCAAEERGWEPAVVTFTPHPRAVLGDRGFLRMLTPLRERLALFRSLGLRRAYVLHYTPEFARISADDFRDTWLPALGAKHVVVGEDFRYGAGRRGDPDHLRAGAAFTVEVVPSVPEDVHGMRAEGGGSSSFSPVGAKVPKVSSRRVRALLAAGEVAEAARLLGRPYALEGVVVPGEGRGRVLGFPTANLLVVEPYVFPRRGVYAAWAALGDGRQGAVGSRPAAQEVRRIPAVVNVGVRPTVDGSRERVEAHLLDFSGELYGVHIRLELVAYLREERRFPGLRALAEQIALDVAFARKHFV
ncbi:MAG: bifunctional riboflavin kinase/FMN adenylyltransferase [Brockia lithotrophica]|nr:bifunctional riboflavin kinase/FMN adenylyltransferase [Brockia lithotrophica]